MKKTLPKRTLHSRLAPAKNALASRTAAAAAKTAAARTAARTAVITAFRGNNIRELERTAARTAARTAGKQLANQLANQLASMRINVHVPSKQQASTKIQSLFRGFKQRKNYKARTAANDLTKAKLLSMGHNITDPGIKKLVSSGFNADEINKAIKLSKQDSAAKTIQAFFRLDRQKIKDFKNDLRNACTSNENKEKYPGVVDKIIAHSHQIIKNSKQYLRNTGFYYPSIELFHSRVTRNISECHPNVNTVPKRYLNGIFYSLMNAIRKYSGLSQDKKVAYMKRVAMELASRPCLENFIEALTVSFYGPAFEWTGRAEGVMLRYPANRDSKENYDEIMMKAIGSFKESMKPRNKISYNRSTNNVKLSKFWNAVQTKQLHVLDNHNRPGSMYVKNYNTNQKLLKENKFGLSVYDYLE